MNEMVWLLIVFVFLNILDGFTTWLGLYHLPAKLRGWEANPLFKDVEKTFWPAMIKKGVIVLFGCWLFFRFASSEALYVLNLVMIIVVLNNTCIYLLRRIGRKPYRSPVEFASLFFQRCHLPKRAANLLGFYVLFGLVFVGCYFAIRVVL